MNAFAVNLTEAEKPEVQQEEGITGYTFVSMEPDFKSKEAGSFREAFTDMYNWVCKLLDAGQLNYQVLETAIWIETPIGVPLFFYEAKEKAEREGILVDGKLTGATAPGIVV